MGKHFRVMFTAALGFSLTPVVFATPIGFFQTNLASDQTGVAKVLDPNLINAFNDLKDIAPRDPQAADLYPAAQLEAGAERRIARRVAV